MRVSNKQSDTGLPPQVANRLNPRGFKIALQ